MVHMQCLTMGKMPKHSAAEQVNFLAFLGFSIFKQLVKIVGIPTSRVLPTLEVFFKEGIAIKAFCGQAGKQVVEYIWGSALEDSMHPIVAKLCGWSDYPFLQQWLVQH